MPDGQAVLSWLHIGDLHITRAAEPNYRDLQRIVALVRGLPTGSVDFAVLPGDNADDGTPEQFRLVRDALRPLPMPLHILPGDHDFKPGTLEGFHAVLGAERLPKAVTVRGYRCLFLDVVSAGGGGPDFRLGEDQLAWAERELALAEAQGQDVVVFMHTYPADLRQGAEHLCRLLAQPHVACVDMGHTHYNELANDGATIFMATRSTGQIEEGPPGFSIAAVDGRTVSWRFKPLDAAWPFVLITSPADRRLATGTGPAHDAARVVRAKVLSDTPIAAVECRADDEAWAPMHPVPGAAAMWQAPAPADARRLAVRARDVGGNQDEDRVEPAGPGWVAPQRVARGSDADRIGAWPERGIHDTQLGPNRNGRHW
ncbi:metallophosphoesterase family protein [Lichenicoccus sp.]|uniref:metallophosphoesterase family protein n=1 Tax=Lichenicoccus sp. TaxID=2781899 RepID=UPI003D12D27C